MTDLTKHPIQVAALYKFVPLPDFAELQAPLQQACVANGVMGTILLAAEGINGTIAGSPDGIAQILAFLRKDPRLSDLEAKLSGADTMPFHRMKVRLKKEIVTLGVAGIDPAHHAGTYVAPQDWNALIADPDVVLVDTRNDYEVEIGTFTGAINPQTTSFRELPQWVSHNLPADRNRKVAMFCTGGIRCEKSTAYLRSLGYLNVFHLKGGILKYLEEVPKEISAWQGECFVFDQRVSVGHGLAPGPYDLCHACRHPISAGDKTSSLYVPGVACPKCHDEHSDAQKKRFADRQKQMDLARQRGVDHIAADVADAKRAKKQRRAAQRKKLAQ